MKRVFTILLTAFSAWTAASPQMTLRDCLVYAREHAHDNRISRLETDKGRANRGMALSDVMPYVQLSMNGNMSFGRNIDPETNTYDHRQTLSSGFGLSMSLPVFDGLVRINNIKAAGMEVKRLENAAKAREDEISLAVIRAFFNVSYCKAMVAQMEENLKRDLSTLHATERGVDTGTKSQAEVADIKALVASDEYELTNQKNLLRKAYLQLRGEMGMQPDDSPLDLSDAGASPTAVTTTDSAAFIHPEILEASFAEKESLYNLRAAKGAFSPTISFNAGISTSYFKLMGSDVRTPAFSKQWHDNMGQYLGVSFSLPVFTGLSTINRLKKSRIELRQSRERLEQTRLRIERLSAEAALDYTSASEEWQSAARRMEAERIAFNATNRRYELGDASAIDLYTASAKLSVARANLEGKRIQVAINRLILDYYNGIPFIN